MPPTRKVKEADFRHGRCLLPDVSDCKYHNILNAEETIDFFLYYNDIVDSECRS